MDSKKRLRSSEQDILRELWEFRVLAGLNGRTRPLIPHIGKPEPNALLPLRKQSIERVSVFLRSLKAAEAANDPEGVTGMSSYGGLRSAAGTVRPKRQWLRWANGALMRYQQYPQIVPDLESGRLTTEMAFSGGDFWENKAIEEILWLLKKGQLFRLRQCPSCRNWFYAKRRDQQFCKTACLQKEHSQSEAFKNKRKLYMRKYRKSGNEIRAKSRVSSQGNRRRRK
jgi:hypothetical protein